MKYTPARLAVVASIAAVVGVFVGIVVYFTLVAALMFLLLAAVIAVGMRRFGGAKRRSLASAKMIRDMERPIKTIRSNEHTTAECDENQR